MKEDLEGVCGIKRVLKYLCKRRCLDVYDERLELPHSRFKSLETSRILAPSFEDLPRSLALSSKRGVGRSGN